MMNIEGKTDNSKSVNGSSVKKIITRLIVGGAVIGTLYYAYKNLKLKGNLPVKGENRDNETNNTNPKDNEIESDNSVLSYHDRLMNKLVELMNEDPIFGPEDIFINNVEVNSKFDDENQEYISVDYLGKDDVEEGEKPHLSIVLKINDTLNSENRKKDFYEKDETLLKLRNLIHELKSNPEYNGIKVKVEPSSFYFTTEDGRYGESITYKELRDLSSISGFRYINVKVFNCTVSRMKFVKDFLSIIHPSGGEEGDRFNVSPVVINFDGYEIVQLENNDISIKYLKND